MLVLIYIYYLNGVGDEIGERVGMDQDEGMKTE